ncbi:interleukin-8-like [Gadus chalcogrammus]|uniref:interleukin-8-like n=1 Tax=Gadus chalcogrammus TaxID=1042646 RepID=UPI0024C4E305|nr:interleukin-8-like [Gadus chalcogrammus]
MKKLLPLLLCLALAVLLAHGMPPISRKFNTHCRCAEVESRMIPPDRLKSLKIFPQDAHCHKTEVIAGLTNGERICLNPQSAWVRKLVRFVLQQQQTQPQTE